MKHMRISLVALLVVSSIYFKNSSNAQDRVDHEEAAAGTEAAAQGYQSKQYTIYGVTVPLHYFEEVPANEISAIDETNKTIMQFFKNEYQRPQLDPSGLVVKGTRRGVHPRSHGCLTGTLQVTENLKTKDQVGIFKPGAQYPVTVRFSNASPRATSLDSDTDARGIGIKIHNVTGKHILDRSAPGAETADTQEFTLNNGDAFFSDTAETYSKFMKTSLLKTKTLTEAGKKFVIHLVSRLEVSLAIRVAKAFKKFQNANPTNPLALQYFSITALQHGAAPYAPIVKHSVVPCDGTWSESIDPKDPYFLRTNLKKHINQKEACFKYLIQHRTKVHQSIEDPTQPWLESEAPFTEVATMILPIQDVMPEDACERIVINPWNSLLDHKPVGGINRLRLGSYLMSIEERKKTNR